MVIDVRSTFRVVRREDGNTGTVVFSESIGAISLPAVDADELRRAALQLLEQVLEQAQPGQDLCMNIWTRE